MKNLNYLLITILAITVSSCSSDDEQNTTIDLSQFEDYSMISTVTLLGDTTNGSEEPYEFEIILIRTDENNQIIETTSNSTGIIINQGIVQDITFASSFKEHKVVGIRINAITNNVNALAVVLKRDSNQNQVVNTPLINFTNTVTVTYDFETETETIISD